MANILPRVLFPALILLPALAPAQRDVPLRSPQEREAVREQTAEFNKAITPILETAARSTVRVWSRSRGNRLAYGTVVGDGSRVLTKWSEIGSDPRDLTITGSGGESRKVALAGVYDDEDIAVLEIQGDPLVPVTWHIDPPVLGQFLAAPQPDGILAGFGVVSVLERNLRDSDFAYLGVIGDPEHDGPGVQVATVAEDSGAAAAGLLPGDIILRAGEREISGLLELRSALIQLEPGDEVELTIRRGSRERKLGVLLGNRPDDLLAEPAARLRQMERMGTRISKVRDRFSRVVQTDMRLQPDQAGGPVVDLEGRVLGITLARADRTRSFVMPAAVVMEMLEREPNSPARALAAREDEPSQSLAQGGGMPPGFAPPDLGDAMPQQAPPDPERLRRHLSDVQRLREILRAEMEALERAP